jgi:mannose-6-phosphate isomerase-like protein (cupin superfamily)
VSVDAPGRKSARELVHAGDVSAGAYAKQRLTHWVNNIGKTALEVLEIELRNRPGGLKTEPIAEPASESESFRAYRWILAQGVSTPMHTHKRPYLMVAATPMQLAMKAPDESFMEHPIKAGDFHWIDSQVTHILTNNGKESGILVEVELK